VSACTDIFGKKTIGGLVSALPVIARDPAAISNAADLNGRQLKLTKFIWGIRLNYHENEDVIGEKLASSARAIVF
jgi:hypothetical protein